MKHRIAVIPGDGIGPEVIEEGIKVLKATAEAVDELDEFQYFLLDDSIRGIDKVWILYII